MLTNAAIETLKCRAPTLCSFLLHIVPFKMSMFSFFVVLIQPGCTATLLCVS